MKSLVNEIITICLLTLLQTSYCSIVAPTKCYLQLNQLCVSKGVDGFGDSLEVHLTYYFNGQWFSLTNNKHAKLKLDDCIDINKVVMVPETGDLTFMIIEDDYIIDDVHRIVHEDACDKSNFMAMKNYKTESGKFSFAFSAY